MPLKPLLFPFPLPLHAVAACLVAAVEAVVAVPQAVHATVACHHAVVEAQVAIAVVNLPF